MQNDNLAPAFVWYRDDGNAQQQAVERLSDWRPFKQDHHTVDVVWWRTLEPLYRQDSLFTRAYKWSSTTYTHGR